MAKKLLSYNRFPAKAKIAVKCRKGGYARLTQQRCKQMRPSINAARLQILEEIKKGNISKDQYNTEVVYLAGLRLVDEKLPTSVKKDLSAGIKKGRIKLLKGDGKYRADVYHHPMSEKEAKAKQDANAKEKRNLVSSVLA